MTSESREDDIRAEFLTMFLRDRRRGYERTLADYLSAFPDEYAPFVSEEFARASGSPEPDHVSAHARLQRPTDATALGSTLGLDYAEITRIGVGGQSEVFRAVRKRDNAVVAIKVLHPGIAPSTQWIERFRREAAIMKELHGEGLCPIHEARFDHAPPYIVMDFVAGVSLAQSTPAMAHRDRPTECRRRIDGILSVIESAARTLHRAHINGVIHRDIKPANILATPQDTAVVLDFGLAHVSAAPALTASDAIPGTIGYESPEQIRGDPIDGRTDVFGLGVTLFEAVTGERPFPGPTEFSILQRIKDGRPETGPLRRLPRDLRVCILTAIRRSPAFRYRDAAAFADDLRALRSGKRVSARPPPLFLRAFARIREAPLFWTLCLGLLVLVVAVATLVLERALIRSLGEARLATLAAANVRERALALFGRGSWAAAALEVEAGLDMSTVEIDPELYVVRIESGILSSDPAVPGRLRDFLALGLPEPYASRLTLLAAEGPLSSENPCNPAGLGGVLKSGALPAAEAAYAAALSESDTERRITALTTVVDRHPRFVRARWRLLLDIFARSRWTEIDAVVDGLLRTTPDDSRPLIARAWSMIALQNDRAAVAVIEALRGSDCDSQSAAVLPAIRAFVAFRNLDVFRGPTVGLRETVVWASHRRKFYSDAERAADVEPIFTPVMAALFRKTLTQYDRIFLMTGGSMKIPDAAVLDRAITASPDAMLYVLRAKSHLLRLERDRRPNDKIEQADFSRALAAGLRDLDRAATHGSLLALARHYVILHRLLYRSGFYKCAEHHRPVGTYEALRDAVLELDSSPHTTARDYRTLVPEVSSDIPTDLLRRMVDSWLRLEPDSRIAARHAAICHRRSGNWFDAYRFGKYALGASPEDEPMKNLVGEALARMQEILDAETRR